MQAPAINSFEYKNNFLYVMIRQEPGLESGSYIYRSGINLSRFCPLSWRKGGICSNPAVRGIQLLRAHVSAFATKHGMVAEKAEDIEMTSPDAPHAEGWYHENPLLLEKAVPEKVRELLEFSAMDLVKTVVAVCVPDAKIPASFPDAATMEKFLESLSITEERDRAMAWEKSAKP